MQDPSEVFHIAIAGLLHDVGKLIQRSRSDPWRPPDSARDEGQPVHAAWSLEFADALPGQYRNAARAGAYHHNPERFPGSSSFLSELIALADKLSAGERSDLEDAQKANLPQQMVSIFDRVSLSGKRKAEHFLPLSPLALREDTVFPSHVIAGDQRQDAYDRLVEIVTAAARQEIEDPATYLENLNGAFQAAAWCVPSAYYHSIPDVSLYDHSRMTAALAVCLHELGADRVRALLSAVKRDFQGKPEPGDADLMAEPAVLLVGGDLSGVQSFLYTLSSKGAARSLRGRSFYLQLLTEAVLRYTLRELNLPSTNVIYSGGGHFYLLAPLSAKEKLADVRRFITTTLLRLHGTDLYLAVEGVPVPASGFRKGQFPVHWERMHLALNAAKQQRYSELGESLYELVFAPQKHGGNRDHFCAVCGSESRFGKKLSDPGEADARICSMCSSFAEDIGADLPDSDFVVLGLGAPQEESRHTAFGALAAFGMNLRFAESGETVRFSEQSGTARAVVWALDDAQNWPHVMEIPSARLHRYTVNQVPGKEFDELQKEAEGIKRLGVLRMDVDNLGQIFQKGFGASQGDSLATLSRIATLSFQLSLFFEGWIKRICSEHPDQIYAVYAGGDDLFLIAPWNLVPALAQRICADFERYTAGNPDLHASAGMAFIHGRYPVYQAAEDAGEALELAKGLEGKNAFTFLDQPWKWTDFKKIQEKNERLLHLVKKENKGGMGAPQAVLQLLQEFAGQAGAAGDRQDRRVYGPWMWLTPYTFTRMAERAKGETLKSELLSLRDDLGAGNYGEIGQWGAAARWAQLTLRKTSKNNE